MSCRHCTCVHAECEPILVNVVVDLKPVVDLLAVLARTIAKIEHKGSAIVTSIAEVNAKLTELIKDTKRVLDLVSNEELPAATQAEVDALAARLDAADADVEAVSPEPTDPSTPADPASQPL